MCNTNLLNACPYEGCVHFEQKGVCDNNDPKARTWPSSASLPPVFSCAVPRGQGSRVVRHGWVWLSGAALWSTDLQHGSFLLRAGPVSLHRALASAGPARRRWKRTQHTRSDHHVTIQKMNTSGCLWIQDTWNRVSLLKHATWLDDIMFYYIIIHRWSYPWLYIWRARPSGAAVPPVTMDT